MSRLFTHHDRLYLFQSRYFGNGGEEVASATPEPEEDENGVEKIVQPNTKTKAAATAAHGGFSVFIPHFHKMFGLLALINMLLYITPLYSTVLDEALGGLGKARLVKLSFVHLVLSLSSFEFRIGRNRNGLYTIYREMQLHTIIFTLRSWSVLMCDFAWGINNIMYRMPIILFWHILADVATAFYKPPKGGTTIRRSEDGKTSGYQNCGRLHHLGLWFFSFSQLVGTFMLLTDNDDMARNAMFIMTPVQVSAFLATLVRKGYFSSQTSGNIYFLILWPIFIYHHWTLLDLGCVILAQFLRFRFRLNKYIMWIGLATLVAHLNGDLATFLQQQDTHVQIARDLFGSNELLRSATEAELPVEMSSIFQSFVGGGGVSSNNNDTGDLSAMLMNSTWQPGTGIGQGLSQLLSKFQ